MRGIHCIYAGIQLRSFCRNVVICRLRHAIGHISVRLVVAIGNVYWHQSGWWSRLSGSVQGIGSCLYQLLELASLVLKPDFHLQHRKLWLKLLLSHRKTCSHTPDDVTSQCTGQWLPRLTAECLSD